MMVKGFFDEISMYEAIISTWEITESNLKIVIKEGIYSDYHPLRDIYGEKLPPMCFRI